MPTGLVLLPLLGALALAPAAARADFFVDSTDDAVDASPGDGLCASAAGACTLRAAIMEANALPGQDAIAVPAGFYDLALAGDGEDAARSADLDVTDSVAITGAGPGETVISADLDDGVFDVNPSARLDFEFRLSGVTVQGASGPGIRLHRGEVRIVGTEVRGNQAGGVVADGLPGPLHVVLDRCRIHGNQSLDGGGVWAHAADLEILRSQIRDNEASGGGGGIYLTEARLLMEATTVANNRSIYDGAGLFANLFSGVEVRSSTFSDNVAGRGGGGMAATEPGNTVLVMNSTFSGNRGFAGGGIIDAEGGIRLVNVTITGNHAEYSGGGLHAVPEVGPPILKGVVLTGNSAAVAGPDCFFERPQGSDETIPSAGFNVIGDATGCAFAAAPTDVVGSPAHPVDARLGPLADNGGPTLTHALLPGSPAIDRIPVEACSYDDDFRETTPEVPLRNDQRGVDRPRGGGCDSGAFERAPACSDGLDNDGDGRTDFDGGASVLGAALGEADPECGGDPLRELETNALASAPACGLGPELVLLLPLLARPRRRRRRASARGVGGDGLDRLAQPGERGARPADP